MLREKRGEPIRSHSQIHLLPSFFLFLTLQPGGSHHKFSMTPESQVGSEDSEWRQAQGRVWNGKQVGMKARRQCTGNLSVLARTHAQSTYACKSPEHASQALQPGLGLITTSFCIVGTDARGERFQVSIRFPVLKFGQNRLLSLGLHFSISKMGILIPPLMSPWLHTALTRTLLRQVSKSKEF